MNNKSSLYIITILLFVQYIVVTVIMMLFYDVGNRYAPEVTHYVLDQNYLSDLGRSVGYAGSPNPSYIFYSLTLGLIGIGIFLFFIEVQKHMHNKAKYIILLLALVSAIGYIGIVLYPADVDLRTHIIYAQTAFFSFFITTLTSQIFLDRKRFKQSNLFFTVLNLMLFFYLILLFFGPPSSVGVWVLQIKTIAQKVMVYSQIILCILILNNIKEKSK